MNLTEAIETLDEYNKWRRGADIPMLKPLKIGIALDTVLNELKSQKQKCKDCNKIWIS